MQSSYKLTTLSFVLALAVVDAGKVHRRKRRNLKIFNIDESAAANDAVDQNTFSNLDDITDVDMEDGLFRFLADGSFSTSMSSSMSLPPSPPSVPTVSPQPSMSPTKLCFVNETREEYFVSLLSLVTASTILADLTTPQGKAFAFIVADESIDCNSDTIEQRYALSTLYFDTDGPNWTDSTNWNTPNVPECEWFGMGCNIDGKISGVRLSQNNLNGELPEELSVLTDLEDFDVYQNIIAGLLPTVIMKSPLRTLDLENNNFIGTLPTELYSATTLERVRVSFNLLQGEISTEVGQLTNLKDLWMAGNENLAGTIPTELGLCTQLSRMYLEKNNFGGSLPSELGNCPLIDLQLQNNALSGGISDEFFFNKTGLEILRLDDNSFEGGISSRIGELTLLKDLRLSNNSFTGSLNGYTNLKSLSKFLVGNNSFTGNLDQDYSGMDDLDFFDARLNNFDGPVPSSLFTLPNIRIVYLNGNVLTGTIPASVGSASKLKDLFLSNNKLSGKVPEAVSLASLTEFLLEDNNLTGDMPPSICALRANKLEDLWVDCAGSTPEVVCPVPAVDEQPCCTSCFPI